MGGLKAGRRLERELENFASGKAFPRKQTLESGLNWNIFIGIEWGKMSVAYERPWDIADLTYR